MPKSKVHESMGPDDMYFWALRKLSDELSK